MVEAILMIMLLLVAGFVGTRVANTVRMPHSVFLVFIGVAAGLAIRHFDPHQVASLEHLFPEILQNHRKKQLKIGQKRFSRIYRSALGRLSMNTLMVSLFPCSTVGFHNQLQKLGSESSAFYLKLRYI